MLAAAERFLTDVVGTHLARGPVERHGDTAEATFYGWSETGEVFPAITTVVTLERVRGDWSVTGATTPTISVDTPAAGQDVSSPLAVSGEAVAFEGTVTVTVREQRDAGVVTLGQGFVTGGGDVPRPFSGQVAFDPPETPLGWVVFAEESAVDGSVARATVVPVQLGHGADCPDLPAPVLDDVTWDPALPTDSGWLTLPAGAGRLTVTVRATDADLVELVLTPAGTGTAPYAEVVASAAGSDDAVTLTWDYPDEPVLGHLTVAATGPGGRTESEPVNVVHE